MRDASGPKHAPCSPGQAGFSARFQRPRRLVQALAAFAILGTGVANFAAAANAGELDGVEWLAEDIAGRGVIDNARSTLRIDADDKLSGLAECNNYAGKGTFGAGRVAVSPLAATRKLCAPALMDQERRFLAALASAATYELRGGFLIISDASGKALLRLVKL